MMIRRGTLLTAALGSVMLAALMAPAAMAQEPQPATDQPIQVPITGIRPTGPTGLAILAASGTGTGVQVLVTGAPEGTIASIQTGTCAAIGTAPVGLIGALGTTGGAQADLPIPLAQLTDGAHVVALHPAMDFTATALACGAIPEVVGPVPPLPDPDPAPSEECAGVPEWATATIARLEELKRLQDGLALVVDIETYLNVVATNIGEVQAMVLDMQSATVPAAAATTHQQFLTALDSAIVAGTELIQAFGTSDPTLYQQALTKGQAVNQELLKVRTAVVTLQARC